MNKLLLSLFTVLLAGKAAMAQTNITGDTLVYYIDTTSNEFYEHIPVKNPSSHNLNLKFKKKVISSVNGTDVLFCTGTNCYPPTTNISTASVPVSGGGEYTAFKHQYTYNRNEGTTLVKYTIYDPAYLADSICLYIQYVVTPDGNATGPVIADGFVAFSPELSAKSLKSNSPFTLVQKENTLLIKTNETTPYSLSVTDLTGKTLITLPLQKGQTELPLTGYQSGIYFVSVNGKTQKFYLQ